MGLGGLQNSHSEGRLGGSRPTWSEALSTSPRDTSAHSPGKGTKRLEEKEKEKKKQSPPGNPVLSLQTGGLTLKAQERW